MADEEITFLSASFWWSSIIARAHALRASLPPQFPPSLSSLSLSSLFPQLNSTQLLVSFDTHFSLYFPPSQHSVSPLFYSRFAPAGQQQHLAAA